MFCVCKNDVDLLKTSAFRIEPDMFLKDNAKLELGDGVVRVLHTTMQKEAWLNCLF